MARCDPDPPDEAGLHERNLDQMETAYVPLPTSIGDGSVSRDLPLWPNWSWGKVEPTWHEEDCIYNFIEKVSSICLKL